METRLTDNFGTWRTFLRIRVGVMYMSSKLATVAKEPSAAFRGVPLNVLQLNWSEVSASRV